MLRLTRWSPNKPRSRMLKSKKARKRQLLMERQLRRRPSRISTRRRKTRKRRARRPKRKIRKMPPKMKRRLPPKILATPKPSRALRLSLRV